MATQTRSRTARVETFFARALMFVMAVLIAVTGASLLTTALAIPLTVALWLGAAAMVGLGVWGPLPHDA